MGGTVVRLRSLLLRNHERSAAHSISPPLDDTVENVASRLSSHYCAVPDGADALLLLCTNTASEDEMPNSPSERAALSAPS
jgi:hypothetical protein